MHIFKKLSILILAALLSNSCKNNTETTPNIDIVDYLPAQSMLKTFSYVHSGQTFYGGSGELDIAVEENRISTIQTARGSGRFNTGDVIKEEEVVYTDSSVTLLTITVKHPAKTVTYI